MDTIKLPTVSLFLAFVNFLYQDEQPLIANTSLGKIRSCYRESRHGRKYEAYEGVLYAQPPLKKFRFQPPQPVKPWEGELPAINKSSVCTQYVMVFKSHDDKVKGCEDCLYINIYASIRNDSRIFLPVMFWIHGGAFQFASENEADETLLMDRDIVFVAVNYCLGPFGFLSTGDSVVPGNMGLKYQSQALRWVHDHISNFGGDLELRSRTAASS
ncbi:venom carboxylesterase-6-like [Bombus bifarius]|uniref:Venom carboxylesterase-6-like n=1 Tax=Bombus bifarius TaxID=103933 RepID=A0A6P8LY77_9HYME|nr:venom carboxylesterase-6-like [Bombus bifarius]